MNASPRVRRLLLGAAVGLLGCWVAALPGTASAAPGDVSRVGGQGLAGSCRSDTDFGDDGRARLSEARFNYHSFANNNTLAVDAGGQRIFVPDRSVVRGVDGPVAGVAQGDPPPSSTSSTIRGTPRGLTGPAAEGADPRTVALAPIGVAVDPKAENLYILELNSVRQMNLGAPSAIRTVAGAAIGAPLQVGVGSVIAADKSGTVYVGDARQSSGNIYRIDGPDQVRTLTSLVGGVRSLSVDAGGTALYAAGRSGGTVLRIDPETGLKSVVAGSGVAGGGTGNLENVAATSVSLSGTLAVAVDPLGLHLYISEGGRHRVRKVEIGTGLINTVVGSGQAGYQDSGKAATITLNEPQALAVDLFGNVFMLIPDDCAVLFVQEPAVIFNPPPSTTPVTVPPPTTTPSGGAGEQKDPKGAADGVPNAGGSQSGAGSGAGSGTGTPVGAETKIISLTPGPAETQVVDPSGGGVDQALTQPVRTPEPVAEVVAPSVASTPSPAPPPADAGAVTAPDPGSTSAAPADVAPAVPPSPAAAPAPPPAAAPAPAPGSVPPPGAPQPVANVGLAGGDTDAARGATRYAMVRNDDESSVAGLAMALGGALVGVFLCVMFVAPGASSKPKPRPKGAY